MFTKIYNHLTAALREVKGVIDLASILVGVVVIGVVGGGILATVTMVIPFAQDESTKSDLAAVQLAQSTAYVLEDRYLTTDELVDKDYLSGVPQQAAGPPGILAAQQLNFAANLLAAGAGEGAGNVESLTDAAGTCYVASALSPTGTIFVTTSSSPEITASDRAFELSVAPECLPALAGIAGDDWIGAPELAGAEFTATVDQSFTETLVATGGGDLTYEITAGALPAGVTLTDGTLSGSPTSAGLYTLTVTVTNESGSTDAVVTLTVAEPPQMVSTWDTNLFGCETITLPLGGTINATVNWGDGTTEAATSNISHTYSSGGEQTVTVEGVFGSWGAGGGWTPGCLTGVTTWEETGTTDLSFAFFRAESLESLTEIPTGVTNMAHMFHGADVFNQPLNNFDTSEVTDMSNMFAETEVFNQKLNFDTSNVTDMDRMFYEAWELNSPLNFTDTSNVTSMRNMFESAFKFNQDISDWDTSSVTDMGSMFNDAQAFNQDISGWDVGNVTDSDNFSTYSALTAANSPF